MCFRSHGLGSGIEDLGFEGLVLVAGECQWDQMPGSLQGVYVR